MSVRSLPVRPRTVGSLTIASYVDQTLGSDERIIRRGHFHWLYTFITLLEAALWLSAGMAICALLAHSSTGQWDPRLLTGLSASWAYAIAGLAAAIALARFLTRMIRQWTTEIVITDRRFIYKTGWIARHAQEFSISRLESVNLEQSVLGRLFDYGFLELHGTGLGDIKLPGILAAPAEFRRAMIETSAREGNEVNSG